MKRLIKYTDKYLNDQGKFSNCSTEYEVLPVLVDDNAGELLLEMLAVELGYKSHHQTRNKAVDMECGRWGLRITHSLKIGTAQVEQGVYFKGKTEERNEYLGFITLPTCRLDPVENMTGKITEENLYDIINDQDLELRDIATISDERVLVVEGWDAFHNLKLLGYQGFDEMLEEFNIESSVFDDSVFQCHECGAWDYNDSGYTYNYRVIDCSLLGLSCGCAQEEMKNLENYANNPDECIESEVAEELEEEGKIKRLETFIGGMVDGRGGYINGESVREGVPSELLREFQQKHPGSDFVFSHEESGQFQTYFSIYKLTKAV